MNTRLRCPQISLLNTVLLSVLVLLLCVIGALSYLLFRSDGSSQVAGRRTNGFDRVQLEADARTLVAGLHYLLEPEPLDPKLDSAWNLSLKASSELCTQTFAGFECASNGCPFFSTNRPAPG